MAAKLDATALVPAATAVALEVGGERNVAITALVQFIGTFGGRAAFGADGQLTERAADFIRAFPGLGGRQGCTACAH